TRNWSRATVGKPRSTVFAARRDGQSARTRRKIIDVSGIPLAVYNHSMRMQKGVGAMVGALMLITALSGCTGGQEGSAAEESLPRKNAIATSTAPAHTPVDVKKDLRALSPAI